MVLFQLLTNTGRIGVTDHFNPNMVLFQHQLLMLYLYLLLNFNPNMVLFQQSGGKPARGKDLSFQSQYGLILAEETLYGFKYITLISIPIWSYFSFQKVHNVPYYTKFQSQYGLILASLSNLFLYRLLVFQSQYGLILARALGVNSSSSPLYFNPNMVLFQQNYMMEVDEMDGNFNPNMVLFQLLEEARVTLGYSNFNPNMVLFQLTSIIQVFSTHIKISIPIWSYFSSYFKYPNYHSILISIPIWSYFSVNHPYHNPYARLFQSQYGLILACGYDY